jgi:murein tripeptide amidase MpaA
MHPREPYSIKLIEKVLDDVLNNFNSDFYYKYMLDHTLLILFPFVNIDGYYQYQKLVDQGADKSIR